MYLLLCFLCVCGGGRSCPLASVEFNAFKTVFPTKFQKIFKNSTVIPSLPGVDPFFIILFQGASYFVLYKESYTTFFVLFCSSVIHEMLLLFMIWSVLWEMSSLTISLLLGKIFSLCRKNSFLWRNSVFQIFFNSVDYFCVSPSFFKS